MTDQIDTTATAAPEVTQETASPEISFLDSITDMDLRGSKSLADFKSIDGLAKSYVSLEKKLGAPREAESFAADQYSFESPEGYQSNDDLMSIVKEKAVELGVKPEAFKALVETFIGKEHEIITGQSAAKAAQAQEFQDTLKKEWGSSYDDNLKLADTTWRSLAPESMDSVLANMSPNEQNAIAKVMVNIASKTSEETIGKQTGNNVLTREQASHKLENIMNDPDHAYHRGEPAAINEFFELQKATIRD